MIDRHHVEKVLHLNGLSCEASDDEIKALLVSARWHENDVETALVILREDPESHQQHLDTVHKVFNSSDRLAPETIQALLGIDVDVDQTLVRQQQRMQKTYNLQILSMIFISIALAATFLIGAMWYLQLGIFLAL